MIDFKVEPSYKQLYEMERAENIALKRENIRLNAMNEALRRMLEAWDRERKEKASEEALKGNKTIQNTN